MKVTTPKEMTLSSADEDKLLNAIVSSFEFELRIKTKGLPHYTILTNRSTTANIRDRIVKLYTQAGWKGVSCGIDATGIITKLILCRY